MKKFNRCICLVLLLACAAMLLNSCEIKRRIDEPDLSAYPSVMAETDNISEAQLSKMPEWETAIQTLLDACASKGYDCDYEKTKLSIIKYYDEMLSGEADGSVSDQVRAKIISLNTIYTETLNALISYLDGSAVYLDTPSYDAETLTISGRSQYALYENGTTAAVYLMGHGHWMNSDMTKWFPSFQTKIIQVEIGTSHYIVPLGSGSHEGLTADDKFDINYAGFDSYRPFMEAAKEAGITVCLLISPHYFPSFLYELYPDLPLGSFHGFIDYSVNHPVARRANELYIKALIADAKEYDAVSSICLTNECMYYPSSSEYDAKGWPSYLENMFGTIEKLNELNASSYTSFDVVPLQPRSTKPLAYAYYSYACDIFTGWHEWMANIIHENSDFPVTAKVWGGIGKDCYQNGVDLVRFGEFCDIMGCDAYSEPSGSYFDNGSTYQLWNKFLWYDLLRTISSKPVYNMEDHINSCTGWFVDEREIDALAQHVYSDMLGGAVHGRAGSMTWTWVYTHDTNSDVYGSANMRPLVVDRIAKASLDAARLSPVLEAFVNDEPDVYILYSQTSLKYVANNQSYSAAYRASALNTGLNIAYVAEDNLSSLPQDAVLIVPECNYLPDDVFEYIKAKASAGRLVLLRECLKYNQFAQKRDEQTLKQIYSDAFLFYSASADRFNIDNLLRNHLTALCKPEVSIMEYGSPVGEVMPWRTVEYNGRVYVYAVLLGNTYGDCDPCEGLQICYNGKPVRLLKNELDGTTCSSFSMNQFDSVIFSFEK